MAGVVASVAAALPSGAATGEGIRRAGSRQQGRLRPRKCGGGGNFRGRSVAVSEVATVEASDECREAEAIFAAECGRRSRFSRRSAGGGGDFRGGVWEAEAIFVAECGRRRRFSRRSAGGRGDFCGGVGEAIFAAECGRQSRVSRRSAGGKGDFRGGVWEAEAILVAECGGKLERRQFSRRSRLTLSFLSLPAGHLFHQGLG